MKRLWFLPVLLLCAVALYASTAITINPSEMKSGETKKLVDGDKTISVTRNGDSVDIRIDGGASAEKLTISRGGNSFRIERDGGMTYRRFVMPETMTPPNIHSFRFDDHVRNQSWFVCPKDHTMLRVPEGKEDQTYKCPVDGTTMEKRKGRGFAFFFDDDFQGDSL